MAVTVIEKATDHRLTTPAAVKAELQVTNAANDAYLVTLINQASDAIRTWCGRTFGLETVRERVELDAASTSILPDRWPVTELVSVTRSGVVVDVAATELDEDKGLLFRLDGDGNPVDWPAGCLTLTYKAGYVLPNQSGRTLPHDIERAAIALIKSAWFARNRDPLIRSEAVEGAGSTDYFSGTVSRLPPEVENLLIPHRKLMIG
ncbi:hypothetical protein [Aminobacter sp. Piv2-1]|uniref:hypothetical protein n=1 Tax=Aminobacter sp. Piv2-1 TaxID=3031122 RepID=UPI0030A1D68C